MKNGTAYNMSYCIMLSVILFLEELCLKPCGFQKQGDRSISSRTVRYLALPDIFTTYLFGKVFDIAGITNPGLKVLILRNRGVYMVLTGWF